MQANKEGARKYMQECQEKRDRKRLMTLKEARRIVWPTKSK